MAYESSFFGTPLHEQHSLTQRFYSVDDATEHADELSAVEEVEALRQQANRLSHLLQVLPAGVVVLDGKGIVRQVNSQAVSLLGEPLEGELWRTIISRSFKPQPDDGHEVSLIDGKRVKLSITPLVDEPGQLIVITDLTETRQLQSRVSHMQRLSALGKMVASLAHQIRTPLSAAMLYASNLTRKGLPEESRIQFALKLNARLKELESQVNDMLLFAKSGEEQVVAPILLSDLMQAIQPTATTITDTASQDLRFAGFEQRIQITGNLTALQGALLNLIENASQVSPKQSRIKVYANIDKTMLNICIEDEGKGVPKSLFNRIFEPFFTTKSHGTGLGLAVVKSVTTAHKGQLSVENTESGGARFTVSLPFAYIEQAQFNRLTGEQV
ncbi:sensor histidine kinase [Alteromonas sp. ASW11-130]|uniref:sensor histidine kinase n=1 Tax=Alteromonas sp. ASW11-130 TaxID=3015775 RepID=UPI002241B835|nr:ATP-binding protein [Alteromonas sp. ASW11-130]MCW8090355.1 ATP-binding protein [Alteromonas sp. ASW11-130]